MFYNKTPDVPLVMKKIYSLFAAIGAMLAFSSCSTFSLVNSEVYNNANLADFHTFRIITPDEEALPPSMQAVTYYNIAAAIREQMVERGYVEDPNSPVIINIGLTIKKELMTEPVAAVLPPAPVPGPPPLGPVPGPGHFFPYNGPGPVPPYAPYFMMPRQLYWNNVYTPAGQVVTGVYREGVLTMDIADIATHTALFSSSVATIMQPGDAQFRNLSEIAQAVQILFKKFPVPVLPQYAKSK